MKSRNEFLVNSAFKTAGDLSHANKQCWRISNVKAIKGRFPYTSTLGKTDRQTNKKQPHMKVLKRKISSSLCQQARKRKTSPFPSPSACIQSMLKNKAKQNRKQSLTLCSYLKSIRTSHQCKIKHLLKSSFMKPWSWKQRIPMKTCFAFKPSLVSKRGDR